MNKNDLDARNRIMKAATEILNEAGSIDKITIRKIAERANVGVGLINYHFQTKDNLLGIAIGNEMALMADNLVKAGSGSDLGPVDRVKNMLKELFSYGERHKEYLKYTVTQSIINGDMGAQLALIPVIRNIFGDQKDEMQLRIIALQILLPLQVSALSPIPFRYYSGIDLFDEAQRNKFIDTLVDNLAKD